MATTTTTTAPSGDFQDPSASAAAGGLSVSGAYGIPTADTQTVIPGGLTDANGKPLTYQTAVQEFLKWPEAQRQQLADLLRAAGYYVGISSGSAIDQEASAYVRLLRDSIWSGKDPNSMLQDQMQAQASTATGAASPRTIGLGKFPVALTSQQDVNMVADNVAQTLLKRRATPVEQAAIGAILTAAERAGKPAAQQQYVSQNLPYLEMQHGGLMSDTQAVDATPTVGAATPQAMPAGGAGSVSQTFSSMGGTSASGQQVLPSGTPPAQIPQGSIQLADGTWVTPPQPIEYTAAPSPEASAYNYYMTNDRPEVNAAVMANVLSSFAQTFGKVGG